MVSILEYDKDFEEKKLREAEYEAGREEGARFGLAEGIVETGCAYNVPEPDILARLQEKLDIPLRKAQDIGAQVRCILRLIIESEPVRGTGLWHLQ